jgi:hypothetical protein
MSVTRNIAAMYRGPGRVTDRILSAGPREDRALAYLMAACALMFIAQLPKLARQAHLTGDDLNMLMGGALLGLVFIAPLVFYILAWISHLIARLLGGRGSFWSARMALFWALLASSPLLLLHGLVAGFIGPGPQLTIVGVAWCVVFFWFWGTGLWRAEGGRPA